MWVEKYRPKTLSEYRGASNQKEELTEWLEGWEKGDKPVLLYGQAGTGKTSLAEALANDHDLELVETNASDVRTKKKLKKELKEATRQASFFGKQKLILIDEVDGMSGNSDRGGTAELARIVDESRFPVIMTANDAYDNSIRTLKNKSKQVELNSVHTNSINAHLKEILENEGIEYEKSAVKTIARRGGGQIRSAINDLEAAARGKEKLTKEDVEVIGARDKEQDVFEALKMVFKTENADTAKRATDNLDEDAGTFIEWVRENIPREYQRSEDVSGAYNQISRADVFNGRIRNTMNWSLLKYVYHFSTIGVALAKNQKYSGWTKYQYPSKIRRMGSSRAARNKLESIEKKVGKKLHVSGREARAMLPFISGLLEENSELAEQLELEEDETEFISSF
ncbi:replication factor C large subunit [Candidatus Nanohalococcus occultus]|uniref:replication factor C large subunit n=1 Tax=Candidatus Nanohalococcus occultus TaxID=2978047 RepID=UPI0039E11D6E